MIAAAPRPPAATPASVAGEAPAGGALLRAVRRAPTGDRPAAERCDLCGVPVPERHRHVLDEPREELLCACLACTLLFERDAAGRGHYRLVPDGRRRLPELSPRELGIPVGLAFMIARPGGTVMAHYPSPLGVTQWEIDPEVWRRTTAHLPEAAAMTPLVQGLLVNTARAAREYWIVPVDDCYRLVALIRREWKGLSGGGRVGPAIEAFFRDLDQGAGSPLRAVH